jgi:hypothetical protein
MKLIEMSMPISFDKEFIADLMVTAFEGGINYWCQEVRVPNFPEGCKYASDVVAAGGDVVLITDDFPPKTLNLEALKNGLQKMVDHPNPRYKQQVLESLEDYDVDFADNAVQFAAFGEQVYC